MDSGPFKPDSAFRWVDLAGEEVEDGRLACAVRSDEPVEGAACDVNRERLDGGETAKALRDVARLEKPGGRHQRLPPLTAGRRFGRCIQITPHSLLAVSP